MMYDRVTIYLGVIGPEDFLAWETPYAKAFSKLASSSPLSESVFLLSLLSRSLLGVSPFKEIEF